MEARTPKPNDIIEIIESHYVPSQTIGNRYVVVDCFDGYDVWIINERGEYEGVCGEDFKIVDNVDDARARFIDAIKERDKKLMEKGCEEE
jgi:hypothetical protein